jgi:hypothetical protein
VLTKLKKYGPEQTRKKLDDRSQVMILIGYHRTGAYKLYVPREKKVILIKDMLFDDVKGWSRKHHI